MKILSINNKKCNGCGLCIAECTANLFSMNGTKKAVHSDPVGWCTGCGHCIAVCP
ncbi:MAG: 4Fe-4S dicluster domain-containing protein [Spirochaetales bacterium]|nr:4Fe-4S dicluster domain-containing protein [Spirochaetales bacterium]